MLRRLPAVYLAVTLAASRAVSGHPTTHALALTPDRLAAAKLWLLPSSAVVVNGPPLPQLAGLVPALLVAQRRLGATFVAWLMIIAHVGATLLTYAALGLFTGDADGADNRHLDYGISAVWLGALGALTAYALPWARRGHRRAIAMVALGAVAFGTGVALFPLLPATEHGVAFALGAGLVWARGRPLTGVR